MQSLFYEIDKNSNDQFWIPPDINILAESSNIIHGGILTEVKPTGKSHETYFRLTKSYLIGISMSTSEIKKATKLRWKIIEPFLEERKEDNKFGFRICFGNQSQYFYAKSSDDLDKWIDKLSRLAVMTDIENDYKFLKQLGSGAFSIVYLAKDLDNFKQVAIKSFKKSYLNSESRINALKNEIEILSLLDHKNVVKLHKVYESENHVHLVLDYLEGGDLLQRILYKGPFDEKKASKLAYKLLSLLEYFSEMNVVHRDIKLDNILLVSSDKDTDFKLADFNLACVSEGNLTARCGSPGYVAPEILRKIPYGNKVDVFSVGIVLYMILSGHTPFSGRNSKQTLMKNKQCVINFNDQRWRSKTKSAIRAILILTQPDYRIRPSAKEALKFPWFSSFKEGKLVADFGFGSCFVRPPQPNSTRLPDINQVSRRRRVSVDESSRINEINEAIFSGLMNSTKKRVRNLSRPIDED
ncbi:unnamed protein product [Blepharisma stoltei]|uniref:Protein kinase domain-containing protein n=1 Tax=Blepharisma stoltei TaxID=1481888 RepID=A0AAU9JXR9_9CILI|nr:unnamed protein product [Blepharisma stoltei]